MSPDGSALHGGDGAVRRRRSRSSWLVAVPAPLEAMTSSANGQVLLTLGADDDIARCARESVLATVGQVAAVRHGVATVVDRAATVVPMRSTSSAPQATARG